MKRNLDQNDLHDRLEQSGWFTPFPEFEVEPEAPPPPRKAFDAEVYRRHLLQPERTGKQDLRHLQKEYVQGKYARKDGIRRNRNPYDEGTVANELWDDGWQVGVKKRSPDGSKVKQLKKGKQR